MSDYKHQPNKEMMSGDEERLAATFEVIRSSYPFLTDEQRTELEAQLIKILEWTCKAVTKKMSER